MAYPRRAVITPAYILRTVRLPLLLVGVALVMVAVLVGINAADRAAQVTAAAPTYTRSFDSGRSGTRTPLPEAPTPTPTPSATATPSATPSRTPTVTPKATPKATAKATTKPTPKATPAATTALAKPSTSGSCPTSLPGLTARAKALHQHLCAWFPQVKTYYGVRADPFPDHPSGRAIDVMVFNDTATGNAIAAHLQANAAELGIEYVIWNQRIWSVGRSGEGWRAMADRGSNTANHRDHVHVSVR